MSRALTETLKLGQSKPSLAHLRLAEKAFREAENHLSKGDSVQASEKLYKVAEECIKAMAEALGLDEACEARRRGRWTLRLLDVAAAKLAEKLGRRVYDDWSHAYFLHVEGFHEAKLSIDQVKARAGYVEELLEIARNTMAKPGKSTQTTTKCPTLKRVYNV